MLVRTRSLNVGIASDHPEGMHYVGFAALAAFCGESHLPAEFIGALSIPNTSPPSMKGA
jgi:hypothetical protein